MASGWDMEKGYENTLKSDNYPFQSFNEMFSSSSDMIVTLFAWNAQEHQKDRVDVIQKFIKCIFNLIEKKKTFQLFIMTPYNAIPMESDDHIVFQSLSLLSIEHTVDVTTTAEELNSYSPLKYILK